MNSSGESVEAAAQFYKLTPADITVVYDELDLVPGKARIKRGGGNGGHNGLRSIDPRIGTDYRRVRLGVGHPGHKDARDALGARRFQQGRPRLARAAARRARRQRRPALKGDDNTLMNKLAIAVNGDGAERDARPETADPTRKKAAGQSHIRAARPKAPQAKLPESGPMAAMLAKVSARRTTRGLAGAASAGRRLRSVRLGAT